MAVPTSGSISMLGLMNEARYGNYSAGNAMTNTERSINLDKLSGLRTSALYGAGGITGAWDTHPNLDANNPINMSEFRAGALDDGSGGP
tara:strand:- start:10600 stop:10866 length:267 start_codon:yes stop_codon:yes gene_type:complete